MLTKITILITQRYILSNSLTVYLTMSLTVSSVSSIRIKKTIAEIKYALKNGVAPEKIKTGTFDTYIMKDRYRNPCAIFKPALKQEEEIIKECAAYLLDYKNFAGVPETVIVYFEHEMFNGCKKGSCQLFFHGKALTQDNVTHICAHSVRRIASLDIRLLNIDRNINNFLIDSLGTLIPIDHNLILPNHFGECFFAWADWKEAHTPFSKKEKKYLLSLNPKKERELLLNIGLDPLAANLYFFSTVTLQIGVALGFTAHQLSFFFEMRRSKTENGYLPWALPFLKT